MVLHKPGSIIGLAWCISVDKNWRRFALPLSRGCGCWSTSDERSKQEQQHAVTTSHPLPPEQQQLHMTLALGI